jgi:hypothetical protein
LVNSESFDELDLSSKFLAHQAVLPQNQFGIEPFFLPIVFSEPFRMVFRSLAPSRGTFC